MGKNDINTNSEMNLYYAPLYSCPFIFTAGNHFVLSRDGCTDKMTLLAIIIIMAEMAVV